MVAVRCMTTSGSSSSSDMSIDLDLWKELEVDSSAGTNIHNKPALTDFIGFYHSLSFYPRMKRVDSTEKALL